MANTKQQGKNLGDTGNISEKKAAKLYHCLVLAITVV